MQLEVISKPVVEGATRPPVVLVHGAWHGAWCWEKNFLDYFPARGWETHAFSFRGHGTAKIFPGMAHNMMSEPGWEAVAEWILDWAAGTDTDQGGRRRGYPSMNRQLEDKRGRLPCELEIIEADLEATDITGQYDGVISSMTLHHIRDIDALFRKFFDLVRPGGFIALADLDREDGSFHTQDTGVHHFGFDRDHLASVAADAGFSQVQVVTASTIMKPQGEYPVFLLTAVREPPM